MVHGEVVGLYSVDPTSGIYTDKTKNEQIFT